MEYEELLIKDYKYWTIYLYKNQYYLGRVYIWAKRENAFDFMDITSEEQKEFFEIGRAVKKALKKLFNPDLFNWVSQGNITPHLHIHLIPRYASPRKFGEIDFNDERWGKNYAPYNYDFKVSKEVLIKIRDAIKKEL
ncbi:MAG: HIT family protein [archaeon]